jgi:hypothetical protein
LTWPEQLLLRPYETYAEELTQLDRVREIIAMV